MKPFPDAHSVLIMDNCCIHHTDTLQDVLNDLRMYSVITDLIYDPYSFDRDYVVVFTTLFTRPKSDRRILQYLESIPPSPR